MRIKKIKINIKNAIFEKYIIKNYIYRCGFVLIFFEYLNTLLAHASIFIK